MVLPRQSTLDSRRRINEDVVDKDDLVGQYIYRIQILNWNWRPRIYIYIQVKGRWEILEFKSLGKVRLDGQSKRTLQAPTACRTNVLTGNHLCACFESWANKPYLLFSYLYIRRRAWYKGRRIVILDTLPCMSVIVLCPSNRTLLVKECHAKANSSIAHR